MSKELTTNQTIAKLLAKMNEKEIEEYLNSVDKLEEILDAPPTEQALCEALAEYMDEPVWIDKDGDIRITTQWIALQIYLKGKYVGIDIHVVLPPHLVEMIAKFYKGKVKE